MNYLLKCRVSLIFLTACLCSCEIADNRGSILSEQGDLISKYRPYSDLIINESRNEIYFVTSTQSDGSLSLVSLNFESKERSVLYNNSDNYADIRLIRNQEAKQQLLFLIWDYTSSGQNYEVHSIDLDSHSTHHILTQSLDEYRIAANDDFIFFNYEYEINYILKSDFK